MRIVKPIILLFFTMLAVVPTLLCAAEITAFGPQQYVRTTGAPNIYNELFEAFPGEAILVIHNGEPGEKSNNDNRVTSGTITLNGEVLFSHADFKHQTYTLEVPINLLESNTLRIELESKPGTYISLEIIQDVPIYDISASDLLIETENCPDSVDISLLLSNTGEDTIQAGVNVAFYDGNPQEGGVLIGTATSDNNLALGEVETISFQWPDPPTTETVIYARLDDDGTGAGIYDEEDETNNIVFAGATFCRLVFGDSSISGYIIDAVNGDLLAGVQARLYLEENGIPGDAVASVESNEEGIFLFPDLAADSYIITVSHAGYIDNQRPVSLSAGAELTNQDIVLSPVLDEGDFRIVLTWTEKPADLEAHLTEPNANGCRYHCYYFNKTTPTASLDLDDRNGYGPETITITDMVSGTYRFYVHDFTNRYYNTRWLYNSGAKVTVYSGSREPLVFSVPNAYGNVWHVFDVDGETGEIIPVHKITRQTEPGRIDYPAITSGTPPRNAYWGSTYRYQTKAVDPDDDTMTYSLENAPAGMTIHPETGLLEWTPGGNQKGWYYNIKIKVDDGRCGETSKIFRLYVYSTPTVSFSVSPCSGFNPGGDITFTWSANRVSTVLIDQGIGEVPISGTLTIPSPEVPTRYTLTAFNDAALIKKYAPLAPGASLYFSPNRIKLGQSTTLYWDAPCSTSRSISHGIGAVPVSGSQVLTPTKSDYYYIYPANAGGSSSRRAYIYVEVPPESFKISPVCNMTPGAPMTLSWHINNATNVSISPDVGPVDATGTQVVYPAETGTYTLTATVNGRIVIRRISFPDLPTVSMSPWRSKAILLGESVSLGYWSGCADTVSFNQGIGEVEHNGTITVTPETLPLNYTVTATNERGSVSRNIRLYHPLPVVNLTPYSYHYMDLGGSVTLNWSTQYADTVSFNQGIGEVAFSGSLTVTPESLPVTYTLTATNYGGTTSRSVTLYQIRPAGTFSANPNILKVGNSTTLDWASTRAQTCSITPDIGPVDCNGSMTFVPLKPAWYTFTMVGTGGTIRRSVNITFVQPLADLDADSLTIREGESSKLTWVYANATSCAINQGIGEVELGGERVVSPTITTTYTMTATGPGGTAKDSVTISVVPANPLPDLSLSLSERIIMRGNSTLLSWTSNYADSVEINQGIGDVSTFGSSVLSPAVTTTYTATAIGPGGTTSKSITVTVMQPPPTLSFAADPISIMAGESIVLSWTSSDAASITLNQGIGTVALQGSLPVSPNTTTTYIATSVGPGGTTTKSVTITVIHPLPTISFSAAPSSIKQGEPVVLTWSTANAESVSIDQGVGSVASSGSLSVSPTEDTVYSVTATGPGGIITEQATVTVIPSPITLTITSPAANTTLARPNVMVTGTVSQVNGLETGVVVNGVIALVYGGTFVANHVPLTVGENTITVQAVDVNGEHVEKTVTVTAEDSNRYVKLSADTESGLAPLDTTLRVSATFPGEGAPVFSGLAPGDVGYTDTDTSKNVNISMSQAGIYVFTAELSDTDGNVYSDTVAILLMDRQQLDTLLQAKWSGMKEALLSDQINDALPFFLEGSRTVYQKQFEFLSSQGVLSQMINKMGTCRLVEHDGFGAVYDLRTTYNDVEYSFQVLFVQDPDGIWRIKNY